MAITTLQPTDSGATSRVTLNDNFIDLDTTKADLASPTFTGTVTLPTDLTGVLKATAGVVSIDSTIPAITIETTTGTTHSLTTTAGQKVIVWAKGDMSGDSSAHTATLAYNGVTKDIVTMDLGTSDRVPFSLMYTETPGAGTQDITVTTGVTTSNVVIIVMKIG